MKIIALIGSRGLKVTLDDNGMFWEIGYSTRQILVLLKFSVKKAKQLLIMKI